MANEWARKVGQMLRQVRPGLGQLATSRLDLPRHGLTLSSPAFPDGGTIPDRYTQDGEALFPPLEWEGLPEGTKSLALIVEDADAPFPRPLVHAVLHSIPVTLSGIQEGGLGMKQVRVSPLGFKVGRNSVARPAGWRPLRSLGMGRTGMRSSCLRRTLCRVFLVRLGGGSYCGR